MSRPRPLIVDISEHQVPSALNYQQLARSIDLVIVRIQYGSLYEDKHYRQHIQGFQQLNVPINVYAWVRGVSLEDMAKEAEDFYQRGRLFQPSFWWLDIEESSMSDMVRGCEAYRRRLKELGAQKVGAYIGNHLYRSFGFNEQNTQIYDGIWLPTYGQNTGEYQGANPTATGSYDLHQYTSQGRLKGYSGPLDFSRLASQKPLSYFTSRLSPVTPSYQIGDRVTLTNVYTSSLSMQALKPLRNQGTITKILAGAPNPYLLDDGRLGWVNDQAISGKVSQQQRYVVKQGESLSVIAAKLGTNWQSLAQLNQLVNPNLIYPGQVLFY